MWRGHVPALTRYTLAVIDEWTARENRDAIRGDVLEFAPEVDGAPQDALDLPRWLGSTEFHDSHRSNLVRKLPEHYRPMFPDVADDLPYFWPGPDAAAGVDAAAIGEGATVWVLRPRTAAELAEWVATEIVTLPETSPAGKSSRAWQAQLERFRTLVPGDRVVLARAGMSLLPRGRVRGVPVEYAHDGETGIRLAVEFDGEVPRDAFPHPVLLQDPRSLFEVPAPRTV